MQARFFLLFAMLLLTACTARHVSEVNAFSDVSLSTCCAYVLLPADAGVDVMSAEWQTLKRQLDRALAARGFYPAATPAQAEIAITAAAGAGESQTVSEPGAAQKERFSTAGVSASAPSNNNYRFNNDALSTGAGSTMETNAPGSAPFAASGRQSRSVRIHEKWLLIRAYDLGERSADGRYAESWRTVVRSRGPSADLEGTVPFMIAAGTPYLGATLYETKRVTLEENSEQVRALTE